jgi:hypothetical protein
MKGRCTIAPGLSAGGRSIVRVSIKRHLPRPNGYMERPRPGSQRQLVGRADLDMFSTVNKRDDIQ